MREDGARLARPALARDVGGQARQAGERVARALVLAEPPSIDRGEITDKGSINQRAVLTHRAAAVESLYAGGDDVIVPDTR